MARDVTVRILGDASQFERSLSSAGGKAESFGSKMGKVGAAVGASFGAAVAVDKVFQFTAGALDAARESNKVAAQTEAAIKSTGSAANVTEKHIGDLSHGLQNLSGVQDENIQSGANMLLTFTNIRNEVGQGNDIFDQATKTLLDMSVATGTDAKSAAVQLGKALNDPVKGITALTRVGVTFTDQQKEQIKAMVAAGDTAGAQKVILAELNKEFGGSAKAAGDALDPLEKLKIKFGDLQEKVGTALIPVIQQLSDYFVEKVLPVLGDLWTSLQERLVPAFDHVRDVIEKHRPELEKLADAFGKLAKFIVEHVVPILIDLYEHQFIAIITVISKLVDIAGTIGDVFAKAFSFVRDNVIKIVNFITQDVLNPLIRSIDSITDKLNKLPGPNLPTIGTIAPITAPAPSNPTNTPTGGARPGSELVGGAGGSTPAGGLPGGGSFNSVGGIQVIVNNPVGEPTEDSVRRELQRISYLGVA